MRFLVLLSLVASVAHADTWDEVPLTPGKYKCRISKEYRFRGCHIEAGKQWLTLSIDEGGHLLKLKGRVLQSYDKKKTQVFIEAALTEERPYLCSTRDPAGDAECKAQKVLIELNKKGQTWRGSMRTKHYWDRYQVVDGVRKEVGHSVNVSNLLVELRK